MTALKSRSKKDLRNHPLLKAYEKYDILNTQLDMIKKETIERCKQVIEQIGARYHQGRDVCAALDKLKDEP